MIDTECPESECVCCQTQKDFAADKHLPDCQCYGAAFIQGVAWTVMAMEKFARGEKGIRLCGKCSKYLYKQMYPTESKSTAPRH